MLIIDKRDKVGQGGYGIRYGTHSRVVVSFFFWKIFHLQVGINTNLHDFYRNLWVWTWYQYQIIANLDSFWKFFGFHLNIFGYLRLILDLLVKITTNTPQISSKYGHCMKRMPLDSMQIQSKNGHNKVTLIFPSSKI